MSEIDADTILDNAQAPARMTGDEGTVQERPIQEQITADQYAQQKAVTGAPWGIRVARCKPFGTVQ